MGPLGGSVLATVKVPRVDRRREALSDKDVELMLRVLKDGDNRTHARDRAIILTLLGTGLRLNELRELRAADVYIERPIERGHLLVRAGTSKSHRSRRVRLDALAANAVHQYTKDWRPEAAGPADPLFLTEKGRPFTYNGFQNYVRRIGRSLQGRGRRALDGPPLSPLLGDEQPPERHDDLRHRSGRWMERLRDGSAIHP